ncbi:MAG: hypothetical protein WA137_10910 [Methanothrix sp.]
MNVERFDNNALFITRQDTAGNHMEDSVTWNRNGATWYGTWKADG